MASKSRRRSTSAQDGASNTNSSARGAQGASQKEEGGGLFGWAKRAGDWIGDQWDNTKETVGGIVDDAQEFVGNAVDFVGDVVDVVKTTDISLSGGELKISADADEIMDMLPENLRQQFKLDRKASDNRFDLSIDRKNGTLTLRSDAVAFEGLDLKQFSAGQTSAQDVEIVLTDKDGKLSFDGLTDINQYNVRVRVGGVDMTQVAMKDGLGRATTEVSAAQVSGFSFDASKDENGMINAQLGAESINATGLEGETAAKSLSLSKVGLSLNQAEESANLSVGAASAEGLATEQGSGSGSVAGLNVSVNNKGGGLPFMDATPDQLRAHVDVQQAEVRGLDTEKFDAGFLSMAAASVDYDQTKGATSGSFGALDGADIDGPIDAGKLAVRDGSFSALGNKVDANLASVSATDLDLSGLAKDPSKTEPSALQLGLDVGRVDVNRVTLPNETSLGRAGVDGLSVRSGEGATRITADKADAKDIRSGKTTVDAGKGEGINVLTTAGGSLSLGTDKASVQGLSMGDLHVKSGSSVDGRVRVTPDSLSASAGSLEAQGVTKGDLSVGSASVKDGSALIDKASGDLRATASSADLARIRKGEDLSVAKASLGETAIRSKGGVTDATVASASASGIKGPGGLGVASVNANTIVAQAEGKSVTGSAARVGVAGVTGPDGLSLARGTATGVQGASGPSGAAVSAESLALRSLTAGGNSVSAVDAHGVSAGKDASGVSALVDHASIAGVKAGDNSVERANIAGLRANVAGGVTTASLAKADAKGIVAGGATVDAAKVSGVNANIAGGVTTASVAKADAQGIVAGDASVGAVQAERLAATLGGGEVSANVGHVAAQNISTPQASALSAEASGVAASTGKSGQHLSVDALAANKVVAGGTTVNQAVAQGLVVDKDAAKTQFGLGGASVSGLSQTGNGATTTVDNATVAGVQGSLTGKDLSASVAALDAQGVRHKGAVGASSSGGSSGLDTGALIASMAARVDDADLQASVGLNAGKYGSGMGKVKVAENTTLGANLQVRDGRITDETRARVSNPIDAALWTKANGAYVEDGKLKADIGGFFDLNATRQVNEGLGVDGSTLASVSAYGAAAANKMGQPAAPASKEAGGYGEMVNTSSVRVAGSVGLSSGKVDAGMASAQLDSRQSGSNVISVAMANGTAQVQADKLRAALISIDTGTVDASVGRADLDAARVVYDQNGGNLDASLGSVGLRNIQVNTKL